MAQEIVNLGNQPNDGTGDSIRDAFSKVNNNFNEVYSDIAVIQTFIGTNTTIADSIAEIQGFSSVIANFSATQVLFQADLDTLTTQGGYFGSTGYSGSMGFSGSAGYNGSIGYAGSAGAGYTGSMGYAGSASNVIGYTGSEGSPGTPGGYTGSAGYDGSAGSNGYTGSEGSPGTPGGYTGSAGYAGSIGYTGSSGSSSTYTASIISTSSITTTGVSRTLSSKFSDAYSVKDFGAVGDGTTDDTLAIQKLIDALSTSTNGGTVFFPAGAYRITDNLTITWPNATVNQDLPSGRVTLKGEGSSMSFIYDYRNDTIANATNSGAISIDASAGLDARFFTMDMGGFSIIKKINETTITGNPLTYSLGTGNGIHMNYIPAGGLFHDIRIVGYYTAVRLKDCLGLSFSNLQISTANIGVIASASAFSEPTDMDFTNCSISGCMAFGYMFIGGGPVRIKGGLIQSTGVPSGSDQGKAGGIYHRQTSFLPNQLNVDGVYFENQRGDADIYIHVQNGTAARAVNNINNCMFARPENSATGIVGTATNMIYVLNENSAGVASIIVNVTGNGFKNFSPYVADSSRKYVAISGPNIIMNASTTTNFYDDPIETPNF